MAGLGDVGRDLKTSIGEKLNSIGSFMSSVWKGDFESAGAQLSDTVDRAVDATKQGFSNIKHALGLGRNEQFGGPNDEQQRMLDEEHVRTFSQYKQGRAEAVLDDEAGSPNAEIVREALAAGIDPGYATAFGAIAEADKGTSRARVALTDYQQSTKRGKGEGAFQRAMAAAQAAEKTEPSLNIDAMMAAQVAEKTEPSLNIDAERAIQEESIARASGESPQLVASVGEMVKVIQQSIGLQEKQSRTGGSGQSAQTNDTVGGLTEFGLTQFGTGLIGGGWGF